MRNTVWSCVSLAIAVVLGLAGASAFNPDNGFLIHSKLLWRIFGISFEAGGLIVVLAVIVTAVIMAVDGLRSRRI